MFKKVSMFSILILLVLFIFSSGCTSPDEVKINIGYWAYFDQQLDLDDISRALFEKNITFDNNGDVINLVLEKTEVNDTFESSEVSIWKESWTSGGYTSELLLTLDDSEYPPLRKTLDYREKLDQRKPYLENTMEYIIDIIEESTGNTPIKTEFDYDDTY